MKDVCRYLFQISHPPFTASPDHRRVLTRTHTVCHDEDYQLDAIAPKGAKIICPQQISSWHTSTLTLTLYNFLSPSPPFSPICTEQTPECMLSPWCHHVVVVVVLVVHQNSTK